MPPMSPIFKIVVHTKMIYKNGFRSDQVGDWEILENKEGREFYVLVSTEQRQKKRLDGNTHKFDEIKKLKPKDLEKVISVDCLLSRNTTKTLTN